MLFPTLALIIKMNLLMHTDYEYLKGNEFLISSLNTFLHATQTYKKKGENALFIRFLLPICLNIKIHKLEFNEKLKLCLDYFLNEFLFAYYINTIKQNFLKCRKI